MNSATPFIILGIVIVVLIVAAGLASLILVATRDYVEPLPLESNITLTDEAHAHFVSVTNQDIAAAKRAHGASDVETLPPFGQEDYRAVYPLLHTIDFVGVETSGDTAASSEEEGVASDAPITLAGTRTLVKNIARRTNLPATTATEIDALIHAIGGPARQAATPPLDETLSGTQ